MTTGTFGEALAALSFSGALMAAIAYLMAARTPAHDPARQGWRMLGASSFILHALSVVGVIATLFHLIYTHQYQYHYVWSHSSNELPVYYMISCFWEGQEGSFLLWTFWHVVLGLVVLWRGGEWRDIVLGVVASVNLILASMILGIHLTETVSTLLQALALLGPAGYLGWRWYKGMDSLGSRGVLHAAALVVAACGAYMALAGKGGAIDGAPLSLDSIGPVALLVLAGLLGLATVVAGARSQNREAAASAAEMFSLAAVAGLAVVTVLAGSGAWKIGSSPFILLRDVMADAPVFKSNPDFVPLNGTGLNPLLQNYWMVIHPPTLFLGFASTVIPFAFVVGGLVTGRTKEWIRPAAPWTIFSVMVLGIGIIMGGYWAYETLNFGGYWNWDPVENSSLVPWLLGIAALHAMVAYRKGKAFLGFTMWLVISVFLFVLYSTFLTRSGILGDASVHTFTDLGLSGQLLLLLFIYLFGIVALYVSRAKFIPAGRQTLPLKSAEFLLFLGVLVLVFLSIIITIATSIPVFNKVLGTSWAPPSDGPFFYYRWTVWLTVGMAVLSGVAQFVFWRRLGQKRVRAALMRPYLIALAITLVLIGAVALGTDWRFAFEDEYQEWRELAELSPNIAVAAARYARLFFFMVADKFLLCAALFMAIANIDLMVRLLRKGSATRRVTGGAVAHAGFALMIVGMIFSAGYDQVISKNVNPAELAALPQDSRVDNVLLQKGRPRDIVGYQVTYLGKKEAQAPIANLEVLSNDGGQFKVAFDDATGDAFAMTLPLDVFLDAQQVLDLGAVERFLNDKVGFLKPDHINNRSLFGLRFVPRVLSNSGEPMLLDDRAFTLYPEAEVNEEMGLLAHPSRKILPHADIYAHVSTVAKDEAPRFKYHKWDVQPGDTLETTRATIVFDKVSSGDTAGTGQDYIVKAHLRVLADWGKVLVAEPEFRIDRQNRVSMKDAYLEEIHTTFIFTGIDPDKKILSIQAQELENPPDDVVVIQVLKKPWINLLWLGTFVLTFGFIMAMVRRIREGRGAQSAEPDAVDAQEDSPVS